MRDKYLKEIMEKEKEVWRDVPGYEGYYQVSNTGIVRRLDRKGLTKNGVERLYKGKIMDGCNNKGYREVCLTKDGRQRIFKVSQLVAMAFLDHIPNGNTLVVDHIDGDRTNNNVDNLRIVTHRDNISNCYRKDKNTLYSKYVGVSFNKRINKWLSRIHHNGTEVFLGYFDSELEASKAYQLALSTII